MLIYLVEDDESIQKLVEYALISKGYCVNSFEKGEDFFVALKKKFPDLIIMDIMLPDVSGVDILRKVKQNYLSNSIPFMMLTAKSTEYDIVSSLDLGADDYMTKPFSVLELLSRVNSLLRRSGKKRDDLLTIGAITMDVKKRIFSVEGEMVELTYKEFELFKYMLINADIVLTREQLLNSVWGYDYQGESRTVDMHIKMLRTKLGKHRNVIQTVRGVGYKLSLGESIE